MTAIVQPQDDDAELVERLWLATKHGDDDHQAWLREAYVAFFAGQPVPAPRGSGNKEKRIAELEAEVARLSVTTPDTTVLEALGELQKAEKHFRKACQALASTANPTGETRP